MDRYQRVEKPRKDAQVNENEIRITAQGRVRNYITYAMALLQEKGADDIIIKAMGRAINKTVVIAELIKRRIAGLHQNTSIESIDITDLWEPLEEGLVTIETTRHVSMIIVTLSKKELDTSSPGYQSPIPVSQVKPLAEFEYEGEPLPYVRERGRGGRGMGRGRGNNNGVADYEDGGWDGGRGYNGRGRGRGRGGGFRGRGRGYGGRFQESDGYNEFGGRDDVPVGQGNNNGVADYEDGGWDGGRGYNGRGRGRGRGGGFRGRGRGYGGGFQESDGYNEFGGRDDVPIEQGNNNGVADYEDGGWDGGHGYNGRGRGRGRGGGFRGRGRGYGGGFQESDGYNEFGGRDDIAVRQGRGNNNGVADYENGGWDGGRGFNGRGRGRGRGSGFRGRGRGYGGGFQESDGYNEFGGRDDVPPGQGRGRGRGVRRARGYGADGAVPPANE